MTGGPTSRRRVVLLLQSLGGGGAERVAVNVLAMLPDTERHLVLMVRRIAYRFEAEVHVLAGDPIGDGSAAERALILLRNLVLIRSLKRRLGDATWLSFATWANVLNVLSGGSGPVVVSSHNRESVNIQGRTASLLRRLVRLTYPRADAVISVSDSVKRDLMSSFGVPEAKIRTIYNAVDWAEVDEGTKSPLDAELTRLLERPTLVTAGALSDQKGQWHLVRVFARVRALLPDTDARLLVLGEGPLGPYLVGLAREAGLRVWAAWEGTPRPALPEADVVFAGFLPNPFAAFARAAVFVFPSLWEGFGNVILEAMASGALVVTADCRSGPREIVAPESPGEPSLETPEYASAGILMPVFDGRKRGGTEEPTPTEQLWAETLARALVEPELRLRYREPARARARAFSVEALAPAWRKVLLGSD